MQDRSTGVAVVTGGGSGIGLGTAKLLTNHYVVIAGRTVGKLQSALEELTAAGVKAEAFPCDVADPSSVTALAQHAASLGPVTAVIHSAGMSPHTGDAEHIMAANALGTVNVNDSFIDVMALGSCLIDVSSMSAHLVPKVMLPRRSYPHARTDPGRFMRMTMRRVGLFPARLQPSIAYTISKDFVVWLARKDAARFGDKGLRILSVSPGNFDTPMGKIESAEASTYLDHCALKRLGRVEEIAELLAFCASDKPGYLTGTDILCDGGLIASGVSPFHRSAG